MNSEIFDIIIPSAFFFIAFFLAFSLLEAFIVLALNRLLFHYWGFTVKVLIKTKQFHGKKIQIITLATIVILVALLLKFTAFLEIFQLADLEIKILALEILLAMLLIYLTTTRKLTQLNVEKSIHRYLYAYLSIIVFVFTVIAADTSYASYKDFINANVTAVIGTVEKKIEKERKNELIATFRQQIYSNECQPINYMDEPGGVAVKHFVYVGTSSDLSQAEIPFELDENPDKYFKGRVCTNGIETFLLTDHGRWYWVINS